MPAVPTTVMTMTMSARPAMAKNYFRQNQKPHSLQKRELWAMKEFGHEGVPQEKCNHRFNKYDRNNLDRDQPTPAAGLFIRRFRTGVHRKPPLNMTAKNQARISYARAESQAVFRFLRRSR